MTRIGSIGSGTQVNADGKVITAVHAVQTANTVDVEFTGGRVIGGASLPPEAAADVASLRACYTFWTRLRARSRRLVSPTSLNCSTSAASAWRSSAVGEARSQCSLSARNSCHEAP